MLRDSFLKGLRDLRRSFPFWAAGVAVLPIWLVLMYPSVQRSAADVQRYVDNLPEAFKNMFMGEGSDYGSPIGFMDAELMSFMTPIVLIVFAVGLATAQIAGEEERGTLSLLLSYPVSRTRLLAQKLAVVAAGVAALTAVHLLAMMAGVGLQDMAIGNATMVQGHLSLGLLTLAIAAVAFAIAAATGRRGVAIGVATVLAVGSYLLNALAPLSDALEPFQKLSVFHYYGGAQPLASGLDAGHALVLLAVAALATLAAFLTFVRRDVRV